MRVGHGGRVSIGMMAAGVLLLAVVAMGWVGRPARALANCTADGSMDSEETAFLSLLNGYRQANGLNALANSATLNRDAAWMVNDLATNHYFDHTDSLGRSAYARAVDCGYPSGAGENLAAGTAWSTAQAAFDAWKASPGHNANMLTSYYRVVGIARVYNAASQYGWYWATEFGAVDDSGFTPPPPTNTPAPTATPTQQATVAPPTATPSPIPTQTSTPGPSPSPTATQPAVTNTAPPTNAAGATATPTAASTVSPTATASATPTSSATATPTAPPTARPTTPANSLPLSPGANLVAWPSADVAPGEALGGMGGAIAMVYQYDARTGTWLRYGPSLPSFLNNMGLLRKGTAYWVIATSPANVPVR